MWIFKLICIEFYTSEPWTLPSHLDTEFGEILNNFIHIVKIWIFIFLFNLFILKKFDIFQTVDPDGSSGYGS